MSKNTGQVKWFNNKIGYGFITLISNNSSETKDIFVHHMNVCPLESNYRTLKTGEYVEFSLDQNCEDEPQNSFVVCNNVDSENNGATYSYDLSIEGNYQHSYPSTID